MIEFIALTGLLSMSMLMTSTFIVAYMNGMEVLVNINKIGEAKIELILLIFFWVFIIIYLVQCYLENKIIYMSK